MRNVVTGVSSAAMVGGAVRRNKQRLVLAGCIGQDPIRQDARVVEHLWRCVTIAGHGRSARSAIRGGCRGSVVVLLATQIAPICVPRVGGQHCRTRPILHEILSFNGAAQVTWRCPGHVCLQLVCTCRAVNREVSGTTMVEASIGRSGGCGGGLLSFGPVGLRTES